MTYDAYTYIIKCPNGKSYYGYRSANKVSPEDDLWKVYFTSSTLIKELREQYDDAEFVASVDKTFKTAEEAHEYETKFITENDCVHSDDWLNQHCFPVFADNIGRKPTEKTKKKISESLKGEKNPMFGREVTDEHRKKISEAKKGVKFSDASRKNMSEAHKGKKLTEKTKKKMSESKMGEKNPMFGKMGEKNPGFGKKHTDEAKKKMSVSQKKRQAKEKRNKENVSIEIHG